jgi:hypothetical protein
VTPDEGGTRDTELSVDIAKRITSNFGIEVSETFLVLHPQGEHSLTGFGNLELGGKYEFFANDEHESIVSLGLGAEVGDTGSKRVGAETFSTWSPALFFGKGFGDLPQGTSLIRPLAITGVIGVAIPTSASTRTFSFNKATGETEQDIERHADILQYRRALSRPAISSQS